MRVATPVCLAVALCVCLGGQALCQGKHFVNSQQHFQDISNRAAALAQGLESPGEVAFLNYYSACSLVYAAKAQGLAQLADLLDAVRLPEDKILVRQRFAESVRFATGPLSEELRVLEKMNTQNLSPAVASLGARLINELRVFDHNAQSFLP